MQTEVLRYRHPDYEIIVRTQDIRYSWEKFKGRINYTRKTNKSVDVPEEYCRYTSKDECALCLYSPITGKNTDDEEVKNSKKGMSGRICGQSFSRPANTKYDCSSMEWTPNLKYVMSGRMWRIVSSTIMRFTEVIINPIRANWIF